MTADSRCYSHATPNYAANAVGATGVDQARKGGCGFDTTPTTMTTPATPARRTIHLLNLLRVVHFK